MAVLTEAVLRAMWLWIIVYLLIVYRRLTFLYREHGFRCQKRKARRLTVTELCRELPRGRTGQ